MFHFEYKKNVQMQWTELKKYIKRKMSRNCFQGYTVRLEFVFAFVNLYTQKIEVTNSQM